MVGLGAFAAVAAAVCASQFSSSKGGNNNNNERSKMVDTNEEAFKNIKDLDLPVIDMEKFFNKEQDVATYNAECKKLAECLHLYGAAVVKDPRFRQEENAAFLDQMEQYYAISDGKRDARPDIGYQVGVTPEHVEKARNHADIMAGYSANNTPVSPLEPQPDNKWRYFWRMNKTPEHTKYPGLNLENIVPPEFPEWSATMNSWGHRLLDAQYAVAEMLAIGFGFPADTITQLMKDGPHLLAPTGSNLGKYDQLDSILAGFHSDLNYITIHGKSRFPGLSVWTRAGDKKTVKVPDGCFLIQAGKQLEYLTAGYVLAGYHEVTVTEATLAAVEKRRKEGKSLWRVSSTLFAHLSSDEILQPLYHFKTPEAEAKFPPVEAGAQVQRELELIKLKAHESSWDERK